MCISYSVCVLPLALVNSVNACIILICILLSDASISVICVSAQFMASHLIIISGYAN